MLWVLSVTKMNCLDDVHEDVHSVANKLKQHYARLLKNGRYTSFGKRKLVRALKIAPPGKQHEMKSQTFAT